MEIKHCVKSVQIQVFPGPHFPVFGLNTDIYSVNIRIQSKYRKIRTRKNSVFARFSRSDSERESLEIHTHNATNETNENKIIRILQTRFHILQFLMFLFSFYQLQSLLQVPIDGKDQWTFTSLVSKFSILTLSCFKEQINIVL